MQRREEEDSPQRTQRNTEKTEKSGPLRFEVLSYTLGMIRVDRGKEKPKTPHATPACGAPGAEKAETKATLLGGQFGEPGFFGDVGGRFEMEGVAIGVGDGGVPHVVADEGFSRLEAAGTEFVVEGDRVAALEPDGGSCAAFFGGDAAGIVFLRHDGRSAEF